LVLRVSNHCNQRWHLNMPATGFRSKTIRNTYKHWNKIPGFNLFVSFLSAPTTIFRLATVTNVDRVFAAAGWWLLSSLADPSRVYVQTQRLPYTLRTAKQNANIKCFKCKRQRMYCINYWFSVIWSFSLLVACVCVLWAHRLTGIPVWELKHWRRCNALSRPTNINLKPRQLIRVAN